MNARELRVSYLPRDDLTFPDRITDPRTAAGFLTQLLRTEASEVFCLICLSTTQRPTGYHVVARGSLDHVIVHPREVFKAAILANAASIIVAHNHPSGEPIPSAADDAITRRLCAAAQLLDIRFSDHIIVGHNQYFSYKEAGRL
jgi:DNA repair protein RadC